jgi:hypothetical protein
LLLTILPGHISPGTHKLGVRSESARDIWNSPFDTVQRIYWEQPSQSSPDQFYITNWHFDADREISLTFSMRPDDNVLSIANYSISPFGSVINVRRDPSDGNTVFLAFSSTTTFAPIGASYTLCVTGVTSGPHTLASSGNCAGETPIGSTLDHIFVYPSPVKESDQTMTFAGLTPQASVIIYTTGMRLLRRLESSTQTGGIIWDLRDEAGNKLPSGVYLYRVSGKNGDGQDVSVAESKFVIVRDR